MWSMFVYRDCTAQCVPTAGPERIHTAITIVVFPFPLKLQLPSVSVFSILHLSRALSILLYRIRISLMFYETFREHLPWKEIFLSICPLLILLNLLDFYKQLSRFDQKKCTGFSKTMNHGILFLQKSFTLQKFNWQILPKKSKKLAHANLLLINSMRNIFTYFLIINFPLFWTED